MTQINHIFPEDTHEIPDPEVLFTIQDRISEGANLYFIQKVFKGDFQVGNNMILDTL